jgi:predicted nucleotidyltransferase
MPISTPPEDGIRREQQLSGGIASLLTEFRSGLERVYNARLRGLYLYGSHARRQASPESDVDLLIVLDRLSSYGAEIDRTSELVSRLSLEYGVSISRVFVSEQDWRNSNGRFLASVREESLPA